MTDATGAFEMNAAGTPDEAASTNALSGSSEVLLAALARVIDPEIRRPITELGMIRSAYLDDGNARVDLALTVTYCPAADRIERDVREAVASVAGVTELDLSVGVMTEEERQALFTRVRGARRNRYGPDNTLTRVIAVGSGKGGVGKSTVTTNLAVALRRLGLAVGVMDLDVHGFSIPGLLGIAGERPNRVEGLVMPPRGHDIPAISIGMFTEGTEPVSWRGPMLHRTIEQFLSDVWFGDLDILLVDLPPGTGDAALSFGQLVPQAEFLVVTTPQQAASDVAVRAGLLARQLGQPIAGVVENMSALELPDGQVLELFGAGGGAETARRLSTPEHPVEVLASIPLSIALRSGGDSGNPVVLAAPTDPASIALRQLAEHLAAHAPTRIRRPLI